MTSRRLLLVCLLALLGAVAAAAVPAQGAEAEAPQRVLLFFTKGEQLATVPRRVEREGALEESVRLLLAGPTADEQARGFRSSVPQGVELRGLSVRGAVATVDLSPRFAVGSRPSLQARLAELVFTLTAHEGVSAVRIALDGRALPALGDLALAPPITRRQFVPAPEGGAPPPPVVRYPKPTPLVRSLQERLVALGYLPAGSADGILGPQTRHAILAAQGWHGLPRDGRATTGLRARLAAAAPPRPRHGSDRHVEVDLARQVALLVDRGRVVRAIHVSTGAAASPTPRGTYTVFRKELRSWSVPYRVWLPYASYFTGGIAFHESPDVPTRPASHGCVRIPASEAPAVYAFATLGTRVVVG